MEWNVMELDGIGWNWMELDGIGVERERERDTKIRVAFK